MIRSHWEERARRRSRETLFFRRSRKRESFDITLSEPQQLQSLSRWKTSLSISLSLSSRLVVDTVWLARKSWREEKKTVKLGVMEVDFCSCYHLVSFGLFCIIRSLVICTLWCTIQTTMSFSIVNFVLEMSNCWVYVFWGDKCAKLTCYFNKRQRVWRRYIVSVTVALRHQEEWENKFADFRTSSLTGTQISTDLLRPFLFFTTCLATRHKRIQNRDVNCIGRCFKILLDSMNSDGIVIFQLFLFYISYLLLRFLFSFHL